jgi:molecular chaperone GrpE
MSQEKPEPSVGEDKVKFSDAATNASNESDAEVIDESEFEVIEAEVLEDEEDIGEDESSENKEEKDPRTKVLKSLQKELKDKNEEVANLRQEFLKLQAETENYKKRMLKEKTDFAQFANEKLIKELVPIYENLDRALNAEDSNADNLKVGVDMICKSFTSFLEKEKVKPIPSVGEKFDPKIHEALSQIESADEEENTVLQEFSKGFYLNDRVLIPAKVVISKKPVDSEEEAPSSE